MAYPHVIRLRGPWDLQPLARFSSAADAAIIESTDPLPPAQRINPLTDWGTALGPGFRGRARYSRRFNRPTGLEAHERVWLVVAGVDGHGQCLLDGQPLFPINGYALSAAADITKSMQRAEGRGQKGASFVIDIDVELLEQQAEGSGQRAAKTLLRPGRERLAGGLLGDVQLEIRSRAFLDELAIWWEQGSPPQLHLAGHICSEAPAERLNLIVAACERELDFRPVVAGESFHITTPVADWPTWPDALDEPVLMPVEIRLLGNKTTLWQGTRETAPPAPDNTPLRRELLEASADTTSLTWFDYVTLDDAKFQEVLGQPGTVVGMRAVLPGAAYHALDRGNVGVVQYVPAAWAAHVCPRLAHHPSIMAWAIDAAEHESLVRDAGEVSYGRRWLTL